MKRARAIVALDVAGETEAVALVGRLGPACDFVKVGSELFTAAGPDVVAAVRRPSNGTDERDVFLDLKLHDIPNTVAKSVEALAPLEPAILTVHAAGGHEMLLAARRAAPLSTRIVAVTLLTSLDAGDLADLGIDRMPAEQVARFAWVARDAGVDGIVCSGEEVAGAHAAWPEGFFVVPGIRPAGSDIGDQKRVVTPARALADGASVLVIGRPITGAPDPARAVMDIALGFSQMPAEART